MLKGWHKTYTPPVGSDIDTAINEIVTFSKSDANPDYLISFEFNGTVVPIWKHINCNAETVKTAWLAAREEQQREQK